MADYDDGQMHPNREDYNKEHPTPTDTGKVNHPTIEDHPEYKKQKEKADKKISALQKETKDKYEKKRIREIEADVRKQKDRAEKEAADKEKEEKKERKERKRPRGGVEIPKQGISRISGASKRLTGGILSGGVDFSSQFSGGLGMSMGNVRSGLSLSGERLKPAFSGRKSPAKSVGYKDPFGKSGMSLSMNKRGRKPKGSLFRGLF